MSRKQTIARTWKQPLALSFTHCKRLMLFIEKKFIAAGLSLSDIHKMLEEDTDHKIAKAAAREWDVYKRLAAKRQHNRNFDNEMAFRVSAHFGCSRERARMVVRAAFQDVREQRLCTQDEARKILAASTRGDFAVFGLEVDDDEVLQDDEDIVDLEEGPV